MITLQSSKNPPSMLENITAYKPFMKMQSAGYANVMKWSDGNYTAELLGPVPSDVPGGDDYTGSTFRQTQVTNLSTTLSSYFSSISNTIAASGTRKYVTPEWFRAHSVRYLDLRNTAVSQTGVSTTDTFVDQASVMLSTSKAVIFRCTSNNLYARVATRSGLTWTVGTEQTVSSGTWGTDISGVELLASDKIVVFGRTNSNYGRCCVVTESGGTLTGGTPATFSGTNAVSDGSVVKIGTDKFLVAYRDSTDANKNKVVAATVSGTTITFGSVVIFDTSRTGSAYFSMTSHTTDAAVLAYHSSSVLYLYGFTVSGTTVTAGAEVNTYTNNTNTSLVTYNSSTVLINLTSSSAAFTLRAYTISGATLTTGGDLSISSLSDSGPQFILVESGAIYFDATLSSGSVRTVYKYTWSGGVFTQVYARASTLLRILGGTISSSLWGASWKHRIQGTIAGGALYGLYNNSQTIVGTSMVFPTLSIQVGSETALTGQSVEFQLLVDLKSNYYRKSYILITRTDVGTDTGGLTLSGALFETK